MDKFLNEVVATTVEKGERRRWERPELRRLDAALAENKPGPNMDNPTMQNS